MHDYKELPAMHLRKELPRLLAQRLLYYGLMVAFVLLLLTVELINAVVNHIVAAVPLSLVRPAPSDGDNVPHEATIGALSAWLYVF